MKSLFIFRRDLRLQDNTALIHALKESKEVIPCFILDPRQLKNPYRSDNALQFLISSLEELNQELKKKNSQLYLFQGKAEEVIAQLIKKEKLSAVYFNNDYTPFSKKRDEAIKKVCEKSNAPVHIFEDALLTPPGVVLTGQKKPYTVYSPFLKKAKLLPIAKPLTNNYKNYYNKKILNTKNISFLNTLLKNKNTNLKEQGGRKKALGILKNIKNFKRYNIQRDFPATDATTKLSAHNKFGTVSIREVYWKVVDAFGKNHTLIAELFWRDFFTHIVYNFPHVLGKSFKKQYDKVKWSNDKRKFKAWCEGKTGFPIVDAGMRELNQTGWMHNRVRMIVASFLVKDLHIDWRWGEKYFAQKLVDYDPAVNNGNWQWAASTGCDAQPYFRIFNPWRQQTRFDLDCIYIKKWIPELKNVDVKDIHTWQGSKSYPAPIIDHATESKKTKEMYVRALK